MKQSGIYHTHYGVPVPVSDHPDAPGEYLFSMEATALTAGIYDPNERQRFIRDCTTLGRVDLTRIGEYGGGKPPIAVLPLPIKPVYPDLPSKETDLPVEHWVDAVMNVHRWSDRSKVLIDIIDGNINQSEEWNAPKFLRGFALSTMLTATLENLGETEIECLEAAAFYALTTHTEWNRAGCEWLTPYRATWFRDWVKARPVYRKFARLVMKADHALPSWIDGSSR